MVCMNIETVSDLIDALDGPSAAGRLLEVTPSAVTNWRRRGHVPSGYVLPLQKIAKRKRWKLADSLFETSNALLEAQNAPAGESPAAGIELKAEDLIG